MTKRIPFNRFQILTCAAALICATAIPMSILAFGMVSSESFIQDVGLLSLYWLVIGFWVGLCAYIAGKKFRSWRLVALSGLGMIIWFWVGARILGLFPELIEFLLFGSGWVERYAADDFVSIGLAGPLGVLPFFIVISLTWALFPLLLASWPRQKNTI